MTSLVSSYLITKPSPVDPAMTAASLGGAEKMTWVTSTVRLTLLTSVAMPFAVVMISDRSAGVMTRLIWSSAPVGRLPLWSTTFRWNGMIQLVLTVLVTLTTIGKSSTYWA